jgi:hypothetical protein
MGHTHTHTHTLHMHKVTVHGPNTCRRTGPSTSPYTNTHTHTHTRTHTYIHTRSRGLCVAHTHTERQRERRSCAPFVVFNVGADLSNQSRVAKTIQVVILHLEVLSHVEQDRLGLLERRRVCQTHPPTTGIKASTRIHCHTHTHTHSDIGTPAHTDTQTHRHGPLRALYA